MRVVIADKKGQVRSALSLLLAQEARYTICAEIANKDAVLAFFTRQTADLLLLDWSLITTDARMLISHLKTHHPDLVVVILGGADDDMQVAIDTGADAFISKSESPQYVLSILKLILEPHTTNSGASTLAE